MNKDWVQACAWLLLLPVCFLAFLIYCLGLLIAILFDYVVRRRWHGEQERLWDATLNKEAFQFSGGEPSEQHEGVTSMLSRQHGEHAASPMAPVREQHYTLFARDLQDFATSQHVIFSRHEQALLFSCFLCYRGQQRDLLATGRATLASEEERR